MVARTGTGGLRILRADLARAVVPGRRRRRRERPRAVLVERVAGVVGYAGGSTSNPSYEEVCTAKTGHAEVVLAVFDPAVTSYDEMLRLFWENHDPTQGMRQGNDVGTQYRSAIYTYGDEQLKAALKSKEMFEQALKAKGYGPVTTEIRAAPHFYYAEDYHQQYLAKNPNGYCGLGGTGVSCPVGVATASG